jgi:hypothetical protein
MENEKIVTELQSAHTQLQNFSIEPDNFVLEILFFTSRKSLQLAAKQLEALYGVATSTKELFRLMGICVKINLADEDLDQIVIWQKHLSLAEIVKDTKHIMGSITKIIDDLMQYEKELAC